MSGCDRRKMEQVPKNLIKNVLYVYEMLLAAPAADIRRIFRLSFRDPHHSSAGADVRCVCVCLLRRKFHAKPIFVSAAADE